jgi:hypothetical protein
MGWATFWAAFSRTHLVSLVVVDVAGPFSLYVLLAFYFIKIISPK